jgi:hypothetical protein
VDALNGDRGQALVLAVLVLGIIPSPLIDLARTASGSLFR